MITVENLKDFFGKNANDVTIPEIISVWHEYAVNDTPNLKGNYVLIIKARQLARIRIELMPSKEEDINIKPLEKNNNQSMMADLLWHSKMPYKISRYDIIDASKTAYIDLA